MAGTIHSATDKIYYPLRQIIKYFCNLLVSFGVVSLWRGLWNLAGVYIYPDDFWRSTWVGGLIGFALVAFAFLTQEYFAKFYDYLSGDDNRESPEIKWYRRLARGIWYRTFIMIMGLGSVLTWRAWWQFWDEWVLQEDMEKSAWTSACTGFGLLILFYSLSSFVAPPGFHFNDKPKFAFTYNLCSFSSFSVIRKRQQEASDSEGAGTIGDGEL